MLDQYSKRMDDDTTKDTETPALLAQPITSYSAIYESLHIPRYARSIRLLSLSPFKDFDAPLLGTLRLVSLDDPDCPSFNALSYVWGTFASPKDTFKCGELSFEITANCKDALRQLRHLYGGITIWVDAICINQSNDDEKQHQISLMRDVYMRAEKVYIWIGNETPVLKRAIKCLATAARIDHLPIYPHRNGNFPLGPFQRHLKIASPILRLISPYVFFKISLTRYRLWRLSGQYSQKDFDELFSQEWFLRAWTFQETVLAYESVMICGSLTINWDTFVRGYRCVNYFCTLWHMNWNTHPSLIYFDLQTDFRDVIPQSFQAFSGVIDLWMRVKRPRFATDVEGRLPSSIESFHEYQKTRHNVYLSADSLYTDLYKMAIYLVLYISLFSSGTYLTIPFHLWGIFLPIGLLGAFYHLALINLFSLVSIRRDEYEGEKEDTALLEGVVHTLRQRKATNPKDKVFALYSILESFGLQLDKPNYNKSQSKIYHELFLALLRRKPSALALLLDAGRDPDTTREVAMADAPSWVPNWDKPPNLNIPKDYFRHRTKVTLDKTAGFDPYVGLLRDPNILVVYGYLKGHIKFCCERFRRIDCDAGMIPLYEAVRTFMTWVEAVEGNVRRTDPYEMYSYEEDSIRVRTVPQSSHSNWHDMYLISRQETFSLEEDIRPGYMKTVCRIFIDTMRDSRLQNQEHSIIEQIVRRLLDNKVVLDGFIGIVNGLASSDRRPFITSHGYLGCGSKGVAVGDQIALVEGVPAPLLLRPQGVTSSRSSMSCDQRYNVICSAFVLGFQGVEIDRSDYIGYISLL